MMPNASHTNENKYWFLNISGFRSFSEAKMLKFLYPLQTRLIENSNMEVLTVNTHASKFFV
jgi:hypothetical protein